MGPGAPHGALRSPSSGGFGGFSTSKDLSFTEHSPRQPSQEFLMPILRMRRWEFGGEMVLPARPGLHGPCCRLLGGSPAQLEGWQHSPMNVFRSGSMGCGWSEMRNLTAAMTVLRVCG